MDDAIYAPFDLPNGRKVRIRKPSVGMLEQINVESSRYAASLIKDGTLLTKQELQTILDGKSASYNASQKKLQEMTQDMKLLEENYKRIDDPEQRIKIMNEIVDLQQAFLQSVDTMQSIQGISIEAMVDQHRRLVMMQKSILSAEDGNLYWPNMEALLGEQDIDSYNVISVRYSEALGMIELTDKDRESLGSIFGNTPGPLEVDDIVDSETESNP